MRRLLLFTFILSFIAIGSCSKDDEDAKVSQEEKENLVKQTIIEFNNSAIKTGKYKEFVNSVNQKTATAPLSPVELEAMLQEFLGDQTQAFLDVYYQLEALNLTVEEFESIAYKFDYLIINIAYLSKDVGGCCQAGNGATTWLLSVLIKLSCGCEQQ